MLEEECVQVPFNYKDENGNVIFRDSLTFTLSEYRNISAAEREAMMQTRYENWLYTKANPVEESVLPEEQ